MNVRILLWFYILFAAAVFWYVVNTMAKDAAEVVIYPSTPPAGYCLVTNGEKFGLRSLDKTPDGKVYEVTFALWDDAESAVRGAWRWHEENHGLNRFTTPEKIARWEERKRRTDAKPFLPVNPELCKNDPKQR